VDDAKSECPMRTSELFILHCYPFRHVHAQCDPEATEQAVIERRATNPSYIYICRACKSPPSSSTAAALTGRALPALTNSSPSRLNEDSNDTWGADEFGGASPSSSSGGGASASFASYSSGDLETIRMGLGKGKPMSVLGGKRGRRGFGQAGRPRGSYSPIGAGNSGTQPAWKMAGMSKPGLLSSKKRSGEIRRRGRQPKIRGMVGLQVSGKVFSVLI